MPDHRVRVTLEAAGVPPVNAEGVFTEFTVADKFKRAAVYFGLGLLGAAMLIPIPIIHLLGIPMMLLLGVVMALRQFTVVGRLKPMRMPCPKCQAVNRIGGGIGVRTRNDLERNCDSCRRSLTRQLTDLD